MGSSKQHRIASLTTSRPFARMLAAARRPNLLKRFLQDESGTYVIVVGLLMPVLIGTAGLGTEVAWWLFKHKNMQSAADSGAVSAATAGTNLNVEANVVTAAYGYANGVNSVVVTVNQPPTTGNYTNAAQAVEVIVSQPQPRLLSSLFGNGPVQQITARAVALSNPGTGCVLALDPTANSSVSVQGNSQLNLLNCNLYDNSSGGPALSVGGSASITANQVGVVGSVSGAASITATNGVRTGMRAVDDPYKNVTPASMPGCDNKNYTVNSSGKTTSLAAGCYGGNITVNAGATLDLAPGVYYINGGTLSVAGNATLSCSLCVNGAGVTLVFTGSGKSWGTASFGSNANVTLTAPNSGPLAGIVMYGDRNMPTGTAFNLTGGGTQTFNGAIYLPKAALNYSGGNSATSSCTKIIADTISFSGASSVQVNCAGLGTAAIGVQTAQLVE